MQSEHAEMQQALAYISSIDEISWLEIDGNNVYVGLRRRSHDLRQIVHGAALAGNRALDFGVHLWAVAAPRGWRPGQAGLLCGATARYGKIETECR